ncbi:MAG: hypothetical protein WDO73_00385 [Ignavibacteriota bacterium]
MTWDNKIAFVREASYSQIHAALHAGFAGDQHFRQHAVPGHQPDEVGWNRAEFHQQRHDDRTDVEFRQRRIVSEQLRRRLSVFNWVKGKHTIGVGANWTRSQLNIINNQNNTARLHPSPTFPHS